jgi:hypothetical protein
MVSRGAPFKLGVEFSDWWQDCWSFQNLPDLLAQIERALAASGYVQGLVKVYQLAGWAHPFVEIAGYSGRDYGRPEDLRDSVLSSCSAVLSEKLAGPQFNLRRRAQRPAGRRSPSTSPLRRRQQQQQGAGVTITDQIGGDHRESNWGQP